MSQVPVFQSHDELFVADTCDPLIAAVRRGDLALCALVHGHYPGNALPSNELTELKTSGYWDAHKNQNWGLAWHRNEGIEITFLENGRMDFGVEDREFVLEPGSMTITRPWQRHRIGNPNVSAGKLHWMVLDVGVRRPNQPWKWPNWIMLREQDRNELAAILRQTDQPVWKAPVEIRSCFQAIGEALESDRNGSSVSALTIRINELLLLCLQHFRKKKPAIDVSLTTSHKTVELFLANLRTQPNHLEIRWSVREMASSCGLGITQFVYIVKQLTNMTPYQFLNYHRLEFAAALLRSEQPVSITELAQTCGYSSSQYFATAFARQFGCSPTRFRATGSIAAGA